MLNQLLWLFIPLAILVVAIAWLKSKSTDATLSGQWPFQPRKPLSLVEQVLWFRLTEALPDHIVLAQVQLSRLLSVKKGHNFHQWNNRINRMSADFVICKKDASVVAVIERDDATHERADRQAANAKKSKALADANVRLIRWQTKSLPSHEQIREAFELSTTESKRNLL
jgi:hypothetical protein